MSAIYLLIPLAMLVLGLSIWLFFWAVKRGQFDDLEGAKWRAISDDNDRMATTSERSPADDV